MAIVEMKKVTLLAMKQDKPRLMRKMQQLGCVQITPREQAEAAETKQSAQSEKEKGRLEELTKRIDRLDLAIKRLSPFDKNKPGMLSLRHVARAEQVTSVLASKGEILAAVDRIEAIERIRGDLRAQEARAQAQIEQLTPWEGLGIPLEKLGKTKTAYLFLATMPEKYLSAFSEGIENLGSAQFEQISKSADTLNILVASHQSMHAELDALLKDCSAARVTFQDMAGTPSLMLDQLQAKLRRITEVRDQLTQEVKGLADHLPLMKVLRDVYALERDQLHFSAHAEHTQSTFVLSGWVPEHRTHQLEEALKQCSPLCEMEFSDPEEGEQPPTMLQNNKWVSPFETIVKMFDQPNPNGLDPTLVMMPFWICFFGMMVSDAGYGIVLGLVGWFLFYKLGRRSGIGRMAFIVALGGVSTVFWGAMYGGWFSIEGIKPILFSPMEQPLNVLILCLALGVVHLFAGLGTAAYMNIKRGKPMDAVYDQFSWMALLIGLGCFAINSTLGMIVAGAGLLTILLFAGRTNKNPLKRIMGGLGSLYGISGYLSDILSYARLFGMGLATGVIGMVVNMLATMLWGSPVGNVLTIVILIFGHTLNLLINTLGAYVHACRLQFIEFFSKFFEGGGREFRPLEANTRYVDIDQTEL